MKKTSFRTIVLSIESKLGLNEESDAEETRELTVNRANKKNRDFRFLRVFLYLLTII